MNPARATPNLSNNGAQTGKILFDLVVFSFFVILDFCFKFVNPFFLSFVGGWLFGNCVFSTILDFENFWTQSCILLFMVSFCDMFLYNVFLWFDERFLIRNNHEISSVTLNAMILVVCVWLSFGFLELWLLNFTASTTYLYPTHTCNISRTQPKPKNLVRNIF